MLLLFSLFLFIYFIIFTAYISPVIFGALLGLLWAARLDEHPCFLSVHCSATNCSLFLVERQINMILYDMNTH